MRNVLSRFAAPALFAVISSSAMASAQSADDIIARYVKAVGGTENIQSAKTLRRTGKFTGGGGFEAVIVQENKRPGLVREDFSLQGMTGINAYNGKAGWKVDPFGGKKDAEALSEEELHAIILDADFDDPLVNYRQKGSSVELVGPDQVEGTDVHKLKLTLANGDVRFYYMDADSHVPIKIEDKRTIRGAEQELETTLGNYKQVGGWYLPFAIESGVKGQEKGKVTYDKIELNVAIDDARFAKPMSAPPSPAPGDAFDASRSRAKTSDTDKPASLPAKPPMGLKD